MSQILREIDRIVILKKAGKKAVYLPEKTDVVKIVVQEIQRFLDGMDKKK